MLVLFLFLTVAEVNHHRGNRRGAALLERELRASLMRVGETQGSLRDWRFCVPVGIDGGGDFGPVVRVELVFKFNYSVGVPAFTCSSTSTVVRTQVQAQCLLRPDHAQLGKSRSVSRQALALRVEGRDIRLARSRRVGVRRTRSSRRLEARPIGTFHLRGRR